MSDERAYTCLRLKLAGVPVQAEVAFAPTVQKLASFVAAADAESWEPVVSVRVTPADIERERALLPEYADPYLEMTALHRLTAEALPAHRRIVFHACVVEFGGRAYAFTAPSGTGKSTHASLWLRYLGSSARVLCGDKPFLHVPAEGGVTAYGSPWPGKEGWGTSGHAPLAGVCVLHQAPENAIERLSTADAADRVLRQCYIPQGSPAAVVAALSCVDGLVRRVPVWSLGCTISQEAVRLSFEAMTGMPFDEARRGSEE